jgi:dihydroxycyclohexadiene carboxylate dehydrogenase
MTAPSRFENRMAIASGRFAGKVAVVTGAAQGIGRAVALRLAAEGGRVVMVDRSEFVREVAEEAGETALPVTADLETWAGAEAAVAAARERFGRLDILINNVGGAIWMKPFDRFAPEEIEAEIRRSLFPTLWCCRAALPAMGRGGVIVNVSSIATRGIHRLPYSAAKGGVNALTASLAWEAAERGIRVVATAPGGTEAPPRRIPRNAAAPSAEEEGWMRAVVDQTIASSLLHRYGTPDEQAAAILFLASDEASFVTGVTLPVSGGDLG